MNQFIVEKQNKRNFAQWASRVLTVDPEERCFYLSRKDDAHDVTYHKILVSKVYFWPDFGSAYIFDSMKSNVAQVTLRLRGREVTAAKEDAAKVEKTARHPGDLFNNPLSPLHPIDSDGTEKGEGGPPKPRERDFSLASAPTPLHPSAKQAPESPLLYEKGKKVHWLLRLTTTEEVALLKNLLLVFCGCSLEGKATYLVRTGDGSTGPPTPIPEGGLARNSSDNNNNDNSNNNNNGINANDNDVIKNSTSKSKKGHKGKQDHFNKNVDL